MCGISGFLSSRASAAELAATAEALNKDLAHRGPDDQGVWLDPQAGIALAHRRLSIVDLSAAGHQPMTSSDGRFVIIYNGEVYNFEDIRPELLSRGVRFRGRSDTEVILESCVAYGVEATVKRLIGMFAFAVWDRRDRTLTLVRDRLGIKPLYWGKFGQLFAFGSELKALRRVPGWTPQIDPRAVASFMRHNYVPAPHTIYEGVFKLEPGSILTLAWEGEPRITRYWDVAHIAQQGLANPVSESGPELADRLDALLKDAVSRRMIADVPLGAFLSGGIDSSIVAALMQSANMGRARTFTIGFENSDYDESAHARAVAGHLGTDHTELIVTAQQARDVIPRLPDMFDEPFADSSQIPTYLVSAMTRHHVTVALSGDGGDELFAGYNRYHLASRLWSRLSLVPRPLRKGLAAAMTALSPQQWSQFLSIFPKRLLPPQAGDKVHKLASVMDLRDQNAVYRRLVTHWEPSDVVPGVDEYRGPLWNDKWLEDFPDFLGRMQLMDMMTYLPDDILTKVDRASMAVGLEARVPLIDHRVVEFALRLPRHAKIRSGTGKWLLRQVLERYVPSEIIDRPKMGFGVPLGEWLRGPLRDWASHLLEERRLRQGGLLQPEIVSQRWREHQSGTRNWEYLLWDVLMLEAWRERWA